MLLETLTYADLKNMDLPPLVLYAVPFMLTLVLVEYLIGQYQNRTLYHGKDFLASVGIGIGNLVVNYGFKMIMFICVLFFYNISPLRMPNTWWSFALCFIAIDFVRYWAHRWAHVQTWLWATHVTHHSSEYYNFGVTFRLSWTQQIKVIFFAPLGFLGFDPVVFFICHQLAILYQFWIHTELIGKLPWLIEFIWVTPSHHRVHHGINPKYIDKNYGSSLIIWDRMFGTFQKEEEKVDYGITTPVKSFNPVYLNFHIWIDLFRDMRHAKSLKDVKEITFGYPGSWRASKAAKDQLK